MAEFCLEGFTLLHERGIRKEDWVISKDLDFCEHCGQWKKVVVCPRRKHSFFFQFLLKM